MKFKTQSINKNHISPKTLLAQTMELDFNGVIVIGTGPRGMFMALSNMEDKEMSHAVTMIQHHILTTMRIAPVEGPEDAGPIK